MLAGGFVFSILLLAVQLGSSQLSPRMLQLLADISSKALWWFAGRAVLSGFAGPLHLGGPPEPGLDETRQFGEGSVQASRRLMALLERLRESVPDWRRPSVGLVVHLHVIRSG